MSRFLTDHIASLPATVPFIGPETQERERGQPFDARIGANENTFGPAPAAIRAMQQATHDIWKYADSQSYDLRHALAAHHGIDAAHIQVGEGIDTLLGYLCRMTVTHGTHVVTSDGAYPTFNFHVAGYGGTLHKVRYRDDHEDLQALVDRAKATGASLIYLSNPDNPMGTWHSAGAISDMIANLPPQTLLVLDEAYVECAPDGTAPPMAPEQPNVIRMRTFSKAYAMAGARVGYAIGPRDLIAAFDRIRNHFGMNRIAQAGALAALGAQDHLTETIAKINNARSRIAQIAQYNSLHPIPSATNFVTVDCGRDGAFARKVLGELNKRGVFVRMPFVAPQDRCIRFGCGREHELDLLARHLPGALTAARP